MVPYSCSDPERGPGAFTRAAGSRRQPHCSASAPTNARPRPRSSSVVGTANQMNPRVLLTCGMAAQRAGASKKTECG
jgi:hypothetical protein